MKHINKATYDGRLFLSVRLTAELTGLSLYYLRSEIKAGRIPTIKCGSKYLVNINRLLEILDALPTSRG